MKKELIAQGQKYRLVGIGTMFGDNTCVASKTKATGYIEVQGEMKPVNLNLFGPGKMGEKIEYLGEIKTE